MKIITLISSLLCCLVLTTCKKETRSLGFVNGFMNGESWAVSHVTAREPDDSNIFSISFENVNQIDYVDEVLSVVNLPFEIGLLTSQDLNEKEVRCLYTRLNSHGDAILASYGLDRTELSNYVEITKIDEINNVVEGQLDLTFYKKYSSVQLEPSPPDTLRFTEVKFKTVLQ